MTQTEFKAASFFALRTPLLPFDELIRFSDGLRAAEEGEAPLEERVDADLARLRGRLRGLVERPEIREALFVASPSLEEGLDRWLADPTRERATKVELTLVKYLARMAGRATPFGLFSGCSVGALGEDAVVRLAPRGRYRRHTRLDGDYLATLTQSLARDPALRARLTFRPSTSAYQAAGRVRLAVARDGDAGRDYQLLAVEPTPHLEAALEAAREGATLQEVAQRVAQASGAAPEEALEFAAALADRQILVPELEPPVTGTEPIHVLIDDLTRALPRSPHAERLSQAREALDALDARGLGNTPPDYQAIARGLKELPAKVELPRLFQVDMVKPVEAALLPAAVALEVLDTVQLLARLTGSREPTELDRFRQSFQERYEGREVPLVEALDEESGIGFARSSAPASEPSPLLRGLAFPGPSRDLQVPWDAWRAHLQDELHSALAEGRQVIALDRTRLESLAAARPAPPPLPDAFSALVTIAAPSAEALRRGDFAVHLENAGGPSGASLLGRFCHADPQLADEVRRHLRAEEAQAPAAIFAEVAHLPEGRLGNVILRPVLREHEIPFLGRSGAPADKQIPVTDLVVSVHEGRVVLRSRRLGREIRPRLTSAFNVHHRVSQGLHRFLAALQWQGVVSGVGFGWGVALGSAPFLPRLVLGRSVLALARWQLSQERDLGPLDAPTPAERFRRVQALRRARRLPRRVALADGDNLLPIDLDNVLSVEAFVQLVKERPFAALNEHFPAPDQLWVESSEGRFVAQLILPFERVAAAARPAAPEVSPAVARAPAATERSFTPGSEWLYAKLYCGTGTADQVLREVVAPFARRALDTGVADRFFFIRYADPEWHLRVRLHGPPAALAAALPELHRLALPLQTDGRLHRLQLDTYQRELERYGGPEAIDWVEQLFAADSEAALGIVADYPGDGGADARWRLALRGMDQLLEDLGLELAGKQRLLASLREGFGAEHRAAEPLWKQLSLRLRQDRASLLTLLDRGHDGRSPLRAGLAHLSRRSALAAGPIRALQSLAAAGGLGVTLPDLAASLLHMHANRVLRSAHRAQELVLYYLLDRLYESLAARAGRRAS